MRRTRLIAVAVTLGFALTAAACGSSDDTGGGGTGGGTGGTGGGTGGTGGGTGGTGGGGGPGTVAGSCNLSGSGLCVTYECTTDTSCTNLAQGGPAGCAQANGTWSTSACSTTDSLGTCRVGSATGDVVNTYYSSSGLTAETAQAACTNQGGVYTAP